MTRVLGACSMMMMSELAGLDPRPRRVLGISCSSLLESPFSSRHSSFAFVFRFLLFCLSFLSFVLLFVLFSVLYQHVVILLLSATCLSFCFALPVQRLVSAFCYSCCQRLACFALSCCVRRVFLLIFLWAMKSDSIPPRGIAWKLLSLIGANIETHSS